MGLNIKNPALEAEIRALAALTGESLTEAIAAAVRDRRALLLAVAPGPDRAAALAAIWASMPPAAAFRQGGEDPAKPLSNLEDFYDDGGLPK